MLFTLIYNLSTNYCFSTSIMNVSSSIDLARYHRQMTEFDKRLVLFTEATRYIYVLLTVLGVLLNAYVLLRTIALSCYKTNRHRLRNSTGLAISTVCVADLLTLLLIIVEVAINKFLASNSLPIAIRSTHCKV
jgi:hypothetical protein